MPTQLEKLRSTLRNNLGNYQISEFAVALYCLIALIVVPLVDLAVVPLRWSLAKSMIGSSVQMSARAETLTEALSCEVEKNLPDALRKIGGVKIVSQKLVLISESAKLQGQSKEANKAGALPADWLPDGNLGPYVYRLQLIVDGEIAPLFLLPLPPLNISGLTTPLAVHFKESALFENTGRDPATGEYYLNE